MQERKLMKILTYLGSIPFLFGTVSYYFQVKSNIDFQYFVLSYSAIILSFLGGIHWGYALAKNKSATFHIAWSNIVALTAWFALLMLDESQVLWVLIIAFGSCFIVDFILAKKKSFPDWFISLRFKISIIVISCLSVFVFY